ALRKAGRYTATADFDVLAGSDVVIICVPTPLRKSKDPDISYVAAAAEATAARFRPGQLVILESTTYPGTTEELLLPLFASRGAVVGQNLFLAFSPERVDPGYLAWKMRLNGYEARFIHLADEINRAMPAYVVDLIAEALNRRRRSVNGAQILALGVAYKRGVADIRESPAIEVLTQLRQCGADISYADP